MKLPTVTLTTPTDALHAPQSHELKKKPEKLKWKRRQNQAFANDFPEEVHAEITKKGEYAG